MFYCIVQYYGCIIDEKDVEIHQDGPTDVTAGITAYLWGTHSDQSNSEITPPPGPIAALCAVQKINENLQEYG